MQAIQTVTVGSGGQASIEFTAIPATFTDLKLLVSARTTGTGSAWQLINVLPNGVTANRSQRYLAGLGSGIDNTSGNELQAWGSSASSTSNTFGSVAIYITNYLSSVAKSLSIDSVTENNATAALQILTAGFWNDTSAITSLELTLNSGNFVEHSTATLYGILAGSDGTTTVTT